MYVNTHIQPANWWFPGFEIWKCYRLRRVVFRAEVESALEPALECPVCVRWAEVHLFVCVSRVCADFLWCHVVKGSIRACGFDEAQPGVFLSHLHLLIPKKLNTPLVLFSDLGARFLDQILRFLYCEVWKPSFGHIGHVQGQADVGLFQLYMTSLPCHRCRHVEYVQEISCCLKQWDAAITSTIYASVASSKVIKACLVHSHGCLSGNWSVKIPELTTLWCSIWRMVRTKVLVDCAGFPLRTAMNWSHSSWRTPAVCCTV